MSISINGVQLRPYNDFRRTDTPSESNNRTLAGVLYTDFLFTARSWAIDWSNMPFDDYMDVINLYLGQYSNKSYYIFEFPELGLSVPVKLSIGSHNIKHKRTLIESFTLFLEEQYPIS